MACWMPAARGVPGWEQTPMSRSFLTPTSQSRFLQPDTPAKGEGHPGVRGRLCPQEQTCKSRAVTEPAVGAAYTGRQKALPSDAAAL